MHLVFFFCPGNSLELKEKKASSTASAATHSLHLQYFCGYMSTGVSITSFMMILHRLTQHQYIIINIINIKNYHNRILIWFYSGTTNWYDMISWLHRIICDAMLNNFLLILRIHLCIHLIFSSWRAVLHLCAGKPNMKTQVSQLHLDV